MPSLSLSAIALCQPAFSQDVTNRFVVDGELPTIMNFQENVENDNKLFNDALETHNKTYSLKELENLTEEELTAHENNKPKRDKDSGFFKPNMLLYNSDISTQAILHNGCNGLGGCIAFKAPDLERTIRTIQVDLGEDNQGFIDTHLWHGKDPTTNKDKTLPLGANTEFSGFDQQGSRRVYYAPIGTVDPGQNRVCISYPDENGNYTNCHK